MTKLRKINSTFQNKNWFEMQGMACPICHSKGWCVIDEEQKFVICMRTPNDNLKSVLGGTLYQLDNKASIDMNDIDWSEGEKLQAPNILHKVYSIVKDVFGLTASDLQHLIEVRGLSEDTIRLRGYFSIGEETAKKQINPSKTGTIWEELFISHNLPADVWKGVPGFYLFENHGVSCPMFTYEKEGICIPCRNSWGQIVGLQIRINPNSIRSFLKFEGASNIPYMGIVKKVAGVYEYEVFDKFSSVTSGRTESKSISFYHNGKKVSAKISESPKYLFISTIKEKNGTAASSQPHYAFTDDILKQARFDDRGFSKVNLFGKIEQKSVVITEGLLKGDIIASKISETKLSKLGQVIVSVAGVNVWGRAYHQLKQIGVERIFSAFDQDFVENDSVYKNMSDMIFQFKQAGVDTYALTWEIGKGLDDCLLSEASDTDKSYRVHHY